MCIFLASVRRAAIAFFPDFGAVYNCHRRIVKELRAPKFPKIHFNKNCAKLLLSAKKPAWEAYSDHSGFGCAPPPRQNPGYAYDKNVRS